MKSSLLRIFLSALVLSLASTSNLFAQPASTKPSLRSVQYQQPQQQWVIINQIKKSLRQGSQTQPAPRSGSGYVYGNDTDELTFQDDLGQDRKVWIYVPPSVRNGNRPVPVVFMLHGTSGDGHRFWVNSGWKEKARAEGFIAVFPSSGRYVITNNQGNPKTTTKWATTDLPDQLHNPGDPIADDHAFIRRLVRYLNNHYPVNRKRVYVTGFSNGGKFAGELLVRESRIFAAGASNGAIRGLLDTPRPMAPFYVGLGNRDLTAHPWPYMIPVGECALLDPHLGPEIDINLDMLRLDSEYRSWNTPIGFTARFNTGLNGNTVTNREFVIQVFDDFAHRYPNGTNFLIAMADLLWPWFNQYTN